MQAKLVFVNNFAADRVYIRRQGLQSIELSDKRAAVASTMSIEHRIRHSTVRPLEVLPGLRYRYFLPTGHKAYGSGRGRETLAEIEAILHP